MNRNLSLYEINTSMCSPIHNVFNEKRVKLKISPRRTELTHSSVTYSVENFNNRNHPSASQQLNLSILPELLELKLNRENTCEIQILI